MKDAQPTEQLDLLTLEEVSELTRVPINTLRFYRHRGSGPRFAKIGGRLMARRTDVEKWVDLAFETGRST